MDSDAFQARFMIWDDMQRFEVRRSRRSTWLPSNIDRMDSEALQATNVAESAEFPEALCIVKHKINSAAFTCLSYLAQFTYLVYLA